MSASASQSELRLVVLGRTGAGRRSAVSTILGLQDSQQGTETEDLQECSKHRGKAAGRKVAVVSGPAWFGSGCEPVERRRHVSSMVALSSPGPHAFLLCVPVNQPADEEAQALDVLQELFGPSAVSSSTFILFTHTEELEEDEQLDDYLTTWRKDLGELVKRCGDRYHTLEARGGGEEEEEKGEEPVMKAVEGLLEKVEHALAESGTQHFSCPLYQEAEERVRERQEEMVRERRRMEPPEESPPPPAEENVTEEEMEAVREEAEKSIGDLNVDVESILPAPAIVPPPPSSFLWGLWERLTGWLRWLPTLVRREALLGALVGLFVGGPVGGTLGATVGSVATEVSRRKTTEKTK